MIITPEKISRTPWIAALVFHAVWLLFVVELAYDIVVNGKLRVAGIQPQDIALLSVIGFLFFTDSRFQRDMLSSWALTYFFIAGAYCALGVLFGNSTGWIRTDLRTLLWLPGGYALFYLLPKTRHPALNLLFVCIVGSVLMNLAAQESLSTHFSSTRFEAGEHRLYGINLFNTGILLLPILGIYLNLFSRRNVFHRIASLGLLALFVYYIIYLSATRNLMLSLVAMLLASLPYFVFRKSGHLATRSLSGPRIALICTCFVLFIGALGMLQETLVFERFGTGDFMRESSARGRVEELVKIYETTDKMALISGSGLGTVFRPYASYEANFLHLGIFTFLFKFGVIGFLITCLFFYVLVPAALALAAFDPGAFTEQRRTALLLCLPPLMPWIVQTTISGGFSPSHFLSVGMCLAIFVEIDRNGVRRLLNQPCG